MERELYRRRKEQFREFVSAEQRLPRKWERNFEDGSDMRVWFDKLQLSDYFSDFIKEIINTLKRFNYIILDDNAKKSEFLDFIRKYDHIPVYGEALFSDDSDMYTWYFKYKKMCDEFETEVHNSLSEFNDFDLSQDWFFIKDEFIEIIKRLKRIPQHGEVVTQNGIDIRCIFDKLYNFDPDFYENLLLELESYKTNSLSIADRKKELFNCISSLQYIPYIQECRFTDGTDMYTWYHKYKDRISGLEDEVNNLLKPKSKIKELNIYIVPNMRKNGGKFYTICTNEGEKLNLTSMEAFEELRKIDSTLVKRGGIILKQDEEIGSINFVKIKK